MLPLAAIASPPVLLVMGDSLSAAYGLSRDSGWVALLEDRWRGLAGDTGPGEVRVINASVSGETTTGGLARLPGLLDEHRPSVVFLQLGANDGLRGLDPALSGDNLKAMAKLALASGSQVAMAGVRLPPNYGAAFNRRFQAMYTEVAASFGGELALVPDLLRDVAQHWDLMQADGLHPTAAAQPIILGNVWPVLEPLLRSSAAPPEPPPPPPETDC